MSEQPPQTRRWRWAVGTVFTVAVALLLCHELLLCVFVVSGTSMEPTLKTGQRVLVLRPHGDLQRGDLILFRNPTHPDEILLKRVLALPGEEIEGRRGTVYVGGFALGEPYVKAGTSVGTFANSRLGQDGFFVVGDNRAESIDSRTFGEIDRRLIVGKVVYTLW